MEAVRKSKSHILSIAGRVIVGFLVARYITSQRLGGEAAAFNEPSVCSAKNLAQTLENAKVDTETNSLANQLLETCTNEFLRNNTIDPVVKKTVDEWLGLDLSQATALQLLEAYEKVLNQRPETNEDPKFVEGCKTMLKRYEEFRDTTSILADSIDGSAIVVNEGDPSLAGSQSARNLLSYAQYGLFCSALIDTM